MYKLIKSFFDLFLLKLKPEDILYSKLLLVFLVGLDCFVNYISDVVGIKIFNLINNKHITLTIPSITQSIIILSVLFLVLWSMIYTTLAFYAKTNRFVQVLTSLMAVDVIFRSLLILCTIMLQYSAFLATILLLTLVYWEFILYIFIFANSFDFNYLKAGLFALAYMAVQHNLSELLVKYICT